MILNGKLLVEVLPLADLYTVYRQHRRLMVFVHKGRRCAQCNREGVLLLVTKEKGKHGKLHVDLYTEDFVLMTVDHVMPKSQARKIGWSIEAIESLDNKQTLCDPCNHGKGDSLRANIAKPTPPLRRGTGAIWDLVYNSNIFNRELMNANT